jgi:large repetitive protein
MEFTKNNMKSTKKYFSFLLLSIILYACQNPFEVGLGEKVDLEAPQVSVSSHTNGDYVRDEIILSGTYLDDFEVQTIEISFDSGVTFIPAAIDTEKREWTVTINTNDYTSGDRELILRVIDDSEKVTENRILLYFDNDPPAVLIKLPLEYETSELNGDFSIKGEATDYFGIQKVEVEAYSSTGDLIAVSDAEGTNSWSYLFKSRDVVDLTETISFRISAYDYAGNKSVHFYHVADVEEKNGGEIATIEQVYSLENGVENESLVLTALDLEEIVLTAFDLKINQNMDLPEFIISNPDQNSVSSENILSGNARAIGMVIDDDGVDNSSIMVKIDEGDWTVADETTGSGLSIRWQHSLADVSDGEHLLWVKAADIYGIQHTSNPVGFFVDRGAPLIEVTSPLQGTYINSAVSVIGTASDGDIVASVEVSTDGGTTYTAVDTQNQFLNWSADIEPGEDGPFPVKVRAIDGTGKTAFFNLQLIVDSAPPEISFLSPQDGSSVNGEITLIGTSSDNSQVDGLEIQLGKPENWVALEGTYSWEYSLDASNYNNDIYADEISPGVWELEITVRASDIASNTAEKVLTLQVDQSLDLPEIILSNPGQNSTLAENVLPGNAAALGMVTDDDGVDVSSIMIEFDNSGMWESVDETIGNGLSVRWEHDLSGLPDGIHAVSVRASDIHGAGNSVADVAFRIDSNVPVVQVSYPIQGAYLNDDYTIAGTAEDAASVSSVEVSLDNGTTYSSASTVDDFANWTFPVAVDTDESHSIKIKAIDETGKSSFFNLQVITDVSLPEIEFLSPSSGSAVNGEVFLLGTSTDNNQITGVDLRIGSPENWITLEGTYSWQYNLDTLLYGNLSYAIETSPGVWELTLQAKAVDIAGNSGIGEITIEINQNLDLPTVTLNNPSSGDVISGSSRAVGLVTDDDGVNSGSIRIIVDGVESAVVSSGDGLTVNWYFDLEDLANGGHTAQVYAEDINGNTSTSPEISFSVDLGAPSVDVTSPLQGGYVNSDFTLTGSASDGNGVASVQVSFDNGVNYYPATTENGFIDWGIDVSLAGYALEDGALPVRVQAQDTSGKAAFFNLQILIDTTSPEVSFLSPDSGATVNGDVLIKGIASDYSQITGAVLKLGKTEESLTLSGSSYSWQVTFDSNDYDDIVHAEETAADSGIWQIDAVAQVTDIAENTITETLTFFIDQTEDIPVIIVSNPFEGAILGGTASALGVVTDDDGVNETTIKIKTDSNDWTDVNTSGSGVSYNWNYDLSTLGGGPHTIQVAAEDIYGKSAAIQTINFTIDEGAPVVETDSPLQGAYKNGDFTIEGTADDGEGVVSVRVKVGSRDWVDIFDGLQPHVDWSYDVDLDEAGVDAVTDGSVSIKIEAADITGKTAFYNLQLVIDTVPPEVLIINPSKSTTVNGDVTFRGVTTDGSPITSVYIQVGADDPVEASDYYSWSLSRDTNAYDDAENAVFEDGKWKLDIDVMAIDKAGNVSADLDYYIYIDNNLDKPTVTVISPFEGQNLGGPVLVSGTAYDDDSLYGVYMQMDVNGDTLFDSIFDLNENGLEHNNPGPVGDPVIEIGDPNEPFEDETKWYYLSDLPVWTREINASGELYASKTGGTGDITIRVLAVDSKDGGTNFDITGNSQELTFSLDNTIPRVEDLTITGEDGVVDYAVGGAARKTITLTGNVIDNSAITSVQISYNNGQDYTVLATNPGSTYALDVEIDTETINGGIISDNLDLRLLVIDDVPYQILETINLPVDNSYPDHNPDGYTGETADINGNPFGIQGTALDEGDVKKVDRVEVYFIRGNDVFNPSANNDSIAKEAVDFGDGNGEVAYTTDENYKIVIDIDDPDCSLPASVTQPCQKEMVKPDSGFDHFV